MIRIDCYISLQCGSEEALRDVVSRALELQGARGKVLFHRVDDKTAAGRGLRGSPSVFINGVEVQPSKTTGFS